MLQPLTIQIIRWTIVIIGISFFAYSLDELLALQEQSILWGWRPLWCFLALFAGIIALWKGGPKKLQYQWKLMLAALISGISLALGFMPGLLVPAMLLGLTPILYIEKLANEMPGPYNRRLVFQYSYIAFVLWNICSTWWISNTHLMSGILAILMNAALMALAVLGFHYIKRYFGNKLGYASFITIWLSYEFIHHRWDIAYPWLTLGNSFGHLPWLIQWYEYTGVLGGSLWILSCSLLCFFALNEKDKPLLTRFVSLAITMLVPIIISLGLYQKDYPSTKTTNITVVQPNLEPHYVKFNISRIKRFSKQMNIAKAGITDSTEFLAFPETSFGAIWLYNEEGFDTIKSLIDNPPIYRLKQFTNQYPQLNIVSGISSYKQLTTEPTNKYTRTRGLTNYEAYNSAVHVRPKNDSIPHYVKSKLVPGAEMMPFPSILNPLQSFVSNLGGVNGTLAEQENREVFRHSKTGAAIAPIICWESVFGEHVGEFIHEGAEILFVLTNDGWWDDTPGHEQHWYMSKIRAIETRRYLARAANMGTTGFISPKGETISASTYGVQGTKSYAVPHLSGITFYTKHGDIIGRVAILLSSLLLLNLAFKRLRKEKKRRATLK